MAEMRRKLVVANWKMHGGLEPNRVLLQGLKAGAGEISCGMAVCAPFPYLAQLQSELTGSGLAWGAQTLSEFAQGAYTGEVSAAMLRDFACEYVIVGHSERRALYGEADAIVAVKFAAALGSGLTPILCVGETLEERESGRVEEVIFRQLDAVVAVAGVEALGRAVVAYEPVWAIGTGKTASPEQAQEVHAMLRAYVADKDSSVAAGLRILYGGSVKPDNAAALFAQADIDGGLIGGASLVVDDFLAICRAAS